MCKFYSAIITKTGELYHNPWTTSHEDIVAIFDLKDEKDNLCRVEFYPDIDEDIWDYKKYNLHIDQQEPEWFKKFQTKTISKLRLIIKKMIFTGEKQMLCGKVIILKDAKIGTLKNVLVYDMISSQVGEMYGSSRVGEMCGSSRVGEMYDSSQVGKICGSSQVPKDKKPLKDLR